MAQSGRRTIDDGLVERVNSLPMMMTPVKTEDEEQECCPSLYSSLLHQTQTEVKTEVEAPTNNPAEQIKEESDEKVCGGPELTGNLDPNGYLPQNSENETLDSSGRKPFADFKHELEDFGKDWIDNGAHWSGVNSDVEFHNVEKTINVTSLPMVMAPVKTEDEEQECSPSYSVHLHQTQTEVKTEVEAPTNNPAEQIKEECDEEVCGGPELTNNPDPNSYLMHNSELKAAGFSETKLISYFQPEMEDTSSVHTGEKPFSCDECGKGFSFKMSLDRHKRGHTGEKPFSCEECGQKFTQNANLKEHMTIHTGERPFRCDECGKRFSRKGCLYKHRRVHTGEKRFRCEECGKRFIHWVSFDAHMRHHTGEKFSCGECGRGFAYKSNLKQHMRLHTGERPFICECGEKFRYQSTFSRHVQIHTAKHFPCDVCGQSFSLHDALKNHTCIHTKMEATEGTTPAESSLHTGKGSMCSYLIKLFDSI